MQNFVGKTKCIVGYMKVADNCYVFGHVGRLDQSCVCENIWWIIIYCFFMYYLKNVRVHLYYDHSLNDYCSFVNVHWEEKYYWPWLNVSPELKTDFINNFFLSQYICNHRYDGISSLFRRSINWGTARKTSEKIKNALREESERTRSFAFLSPQFFFSPAVFSRCASTKWTRGRGYGSSLQLNFLILYFSHHLRIFTLYQECTIFFKKEEFQER